MFAEIALARVATVPQAVTGLDAVLFQIEMLYPSYASDADTPVFLPTEADNVECLWTWNGTVAIGTKLVVGRIVQGDWIVISEACE